jgi:hypothetical protein
MGISSAVRKCAKWRLAASCPQVRAICMLIDCLLDMMRDLYFILDHLLFSRRPRIAAMSRSCIATRMMTRNDMGAGSDHLWARNCTSECTIYDLCFGTATAEPCIIYPKRILYVFPSLGICAVPITSVIPRRHGSSSTSFRSSSSR